MLSTIISDSVV